MREWRLAASGVAPLWHVPHALVGSHCTGCGARRRVLGAARAVRLPARRRPRRPTTHTYTPGAIVLNVTGPFSM